mmetsp:Transcript_23233/g.59345  ORF Transcript_23233/g.59345 Transcript_23233/m.59345 type:complete len:261 (-) Transcript_23233:205-987(-)
MPPVLTAAASSSSLAPASAITVGPSLLALTPDTLPCAASRMRGAQRSKLAVMRPPTLAPGSPARYTSASAISSSTARRTWPYSASAAAGSLSSLASGAVSTGAPNLKYRRLSAGRGMGEGRPIPGRRVMGMTDSCGSRSGDTAARMVRARRPSTGCASTSSVSSATSYASSAPTAANGTMSAPALAASRTKSGSSFHSSEYSAPRGLTTSLAPPGNSSTFSPDLSSLNAASGDARTAPKRSKNGPRGPAQCPGCARPRTL